LNASSPYQLQELASALARGDEHALAQIHELYAKALTYFALKLTHDQPVSEDIASIALTRLWERRAGFDSYNSIKSFLYTTARNAALNHLRSEKVRATAAADLKQYAEVAEDQLSALQLEAQILAHVNAAIENLPPTARKVFELLYFEGLTTEAISGQLNMPVQTVRNNKARALELLRTELLKKNLSPALITAILAYILHP
jgi:RNA polymerase sigma-70 factor (ECF subfamily)